MRSASKSVLAVLRDLAGRDRLRRRLEASAGGARLHSTVEVRGPDRLVLGPEVFVDRGALLHCGDAEWASADAGISIGAHTYIGPNAVLFAGGGIQIGDAVLISPGAVVTSQQHSYDGRGVDIREQPLRFARVVIERDVWIGANATILPGVRVGEGAVVGAGAVVSRDVPANAVVVGVPARVVRER